MATPSSASTGDTNAVSQALLVAAEKLKKVVLTGSFSPGDAVAALIEQFPQLRTDKDAVTDWEDIFIRCVPKEIQAREEQLLEEDWQAAAATATAAAAVGARGGPSASGTSGRKTAAKKKAGPSAPAGPAAGGSSSSSSGPPPPTPHPGSSFFFPSVGQPNSSTTTTSNPFAPTNSPTQPENPTILAARELFETQRLAAQAQAQAQAHLPSSQPPLPNPFANLESNPFPSLIQPNPPSAQLTDLSGLPNSTLEDLVALLLRRQPEPSSAPASVSAAFPWNQGGVARRVDPYLQKTLDLKTTYLSAKSVAADEASLHSNLEIPRSAWMDILADKFVAFPELAASIWQGSAVEEIRTQLGGEAYFTNVAAKKKLALDSTWIFVKTLDAWISAVKFAFPHRAEELDGYARHLNQILSSSLGSSLSSIDKSNQLARVVSMDAAIREAYARNPFRLDDKIQLQIYLNQHFMYPTTNSDSSKSKSHRVGSSSLAWDEECRMFNSDKCSKGEDCKFSHTCIVCKEEGPAINHPDCAPVWRAMELRFLRQKAMASVGK